MVMGADTYPSAGYVTIDANSSVSPVQIAAAGLGPDDGFTSYKACVGCGGTRTSLANWYTRISKLTP